MAPLPKRKTSKARKNKRRGQYIKLKLKKMLQQLVKSKTSIVGYRLSHHADPEPGKFVRRLSK